MTPYLFIAALLSLLSVVQVVTRANWPGIVAAISLALFAGLRFQTGRDWLIYEEIIYLSPNILEIIHDGLPTYKIYIEPIYLILNAVIKTFGGDLQAIFLVSAIISIWFMYIVFSRCCSYSTIVFSFYYGVCFLITQMSTVRFAIAGSFVLLSIYYFAFERKTVVALLLMAIACGFHVMSVMFFAIFIPMGLPSFKELMAILIVSFVLFALRISPIEVVLQTIGTIVPGVLAAKLTTYQTSTYEPGSKALVVVLFQLCFVIIFYIYMDKDEKKDRTMIIPIMIAIVSIVSSLVAYNLPALWTRIQAIAIPFDVLVLLRIRKIRSQQQWLFAMALAGSAVSVLGVYLLLKDEAGGLSYVPYLSVFDGYLQGTSDESGRARAELYEEFRDFPQ